MKGTLEDIPDLCKRYGIHSIIIAIPTLKGSKAEPCHRSVRQHPFAVQLLSDPQLVGSGTPAAGSLPRVEPGGLPFPR